MPNKFSSFSGIKGDTGMMTKKKPLIIGALFLLVLPTLRCAIRPTAKPLLTPLQLLQRELDYMFDNPNFSNAFWGVAIQSLTNGQFIYLRNENKGFMPASNMKLFTTAAALVKLGPDYRYHTYLYYKGRLSPETGILNGDLIIQGSGDPSLTGRYHEGNITKVFEDWADSLKARGIRRITGRIIGDDNRFADEIMGKGWAWDYQSDWYAAQISALSFNDNCIDIIYAPGDSVGSPVRYRIEPDTRYVRIHCNVTTAKPGQEREITYYRRRATNDVFIQGTLSMDETEKRDWFSVENPTLFAAFVFKEVLERKGIAVDGKAVDIDSLGPYPYPQRPEFILARYTSPPLSEIVTTINKISQNLYSELLLRTLGYEFKNEGSAAAGARVVKEFLADIGIDTSKIGIADGSGLSRLDLVTPMQIVTLLRFMRRHPSGPYFYDSLPIAGVDGTIKKRMKGTAAEGNVRAKTGYIGRVRALSGYVTTQDGEELAFAMIANNYTVPTSLANRLQDWVCERLANFSREQAFAFPKGR